MNLETDPYISEEPPTSSSAQYHIVDFDSEPVESDPQATNQFVDLLTSDISVPHRAAPPPPATPPRFNEPRNALPAAYAENPAEHNLHYPPSAYSAAVAPKLHMRVSFLERAHSAISQNLVFQVETEGLTARSFSVRRTYEDFEDLRDNLKHSYPGVLIPPLVAKKVLEGTTLNAFTDWDISKKQKHLQSFLNMLAEHPRLSITPAVSAFLQMTSYRPQPNPLEEQFTSLEKLAGSLTRDLRSVLESATPDLDRTEDPQLLRLMHLRDMANDFEHRLTIVYRSFMDLTDRSRQSASAYNNLKSQLANLADTETNLHNFYQHLASVTGGLALLYNADASTEGLEFLQEFEEHLLLTASMIDVIRYNIQTLTKFHASQRELQNAEVHLTQLIEEKNQPMKQKVQWIFSFGEDLDSRIEKSRTQRDALIHQVDTLRDRVEKLSHHFMDEMKLFNSWKVLGFQALFIKHIDRKIEFHQQAISAWNSLRQDIRQVDTSLGAISLGWWPHERPIASASHSTNSSSLSALPNAFSSLFAPDQKNRPEVVPSLGESTLGHQPGFSYPSLENPH